MPSEPKLTVAVTGPTGEIGRAFLRALDRRRNVGRVLGMARRPFDPREQGLRKTEYRQGDVLDRGAVEELAAEADVLVHLAFIVLGGHAETRRINLEGSRHVFAAARQVSRFVYTSSVAAYGFHADNPQPLTEDVAPRGTEAFYYSAQKAELEQALEEELAGAATETYVLRPCIVAGPDALVLMRQLPQARVPGPLRKAVPPVLPDPGIPFQLVHHDDVASALVAAVRGAGEPGAYNLAGDGTITLADLARALGWHAIAVPAPLVGLAAFGAKLPLMPSLAQWVNAARVPVLMDTAKARRQLRWRPRHDTLATLRETVAAARERGVV
ncbi:NAD-dependent epimerase/dehydratase family protein [Candidatus Solirubrobacter pratensis]|uniref:NAD-dependent epimerase/dehydratase family protein n=1 Tax=Candidatus Solirubrobacter pratensis TaxID=1298857 RepID=UPI00041B69BA|nr:NAD-dependent epimerase/dehydratase family protein [Candidatus Solirubrobacter pratensis]